MNKRLTIKAILKAIGNDKLDLAHGKDYWYFIYDDVAKALYDTHSVYEMRLGTDLAFWVAEGKELVAKMERVNAL